MDHMDNTSSRDDDQETDPNVRPSDSDEMDENDEQSEGGDNNSDNHSIEHGSTHSVAISSTQQTIYDPSTQTVQYHLKTENGQAVAYRVLQVGDVQGTEHHSHVVSGPIVSHQSVAQTIIAHTGSPFGGTATTTTGGGDGPFYVMMAPTQEILTPTPSRRKISSSGESSSRTARDEKRRATHNEVERRRRDKINNWIIKLSKVVPDCSQDHTKQGQVSKGGILAKTCEYIQDLVNENSRLNEIVKENELLGNELDALRQQFMDAKNENRRLRALLQRHGIQIDDNS